MPTVSAPPANRNPKRSWLGSESASGFGFGLVLGVGVGVALESSRSDPGSCRASRACGPRTRRSTAGRPQP
eukprot:scaffold45714_cov69-Phaeocystis_antarctica.AAC.1